MPRKRMVRKFVRWAHPMAWLNLVPVDGGRGADVVSDAANGRYDLAIKGALRAAGKSGFKIPVCLAPAHVSGQVYIAGQQVSYNG